MPAKDSKIESVHCTTPESAYEVYMERLDRILRGWEVFWEGVDNIEGVYEVSLKGPWRFLGLHQPQFPVE